MKFFYCLIRFVYRQKWVQKTFCTAHSVQKDLEQLYPGKSVEQLLEEYYCKKIARSFLIGLISILIGTVMKIQSNANSKISEGLVNRGEYHEEVQESEFTAILESGEEHEVSVTVNPRELKSEEYSTLLSEFMDRLPVLILEDNISLNEVTESLLLQEFYADYPFKVEWESDRPDVLNNIGEIFPGKEDCYATLYAHVSYGEDTTTEVFRICVKEENGLKDNEIITDLEQMLKEAEEADRTSISWKLPENFRGRPIVWKRTINDYSNLFVWGGCFVAVLVYWMSDKDLHDELLEKRKRMKYRYPDLVRKLTLYLGAGMTMRAAFQKLSEEYDEEIGYLCRELQAGVPEVRAYEHLGKRTGVQEYIRLSTLLAQNLKKGNSTLLVRLRQEAAGAEMEKIQNCRRLAEEASTKLLIPMVLFLVVVMLIIMIPAFSSMGVS